MTAPHFFASSLDDDRVEIAGADARHARALRIRPGEAITISDGAGAVAGATVLEAGASLVATVTTRRFVEPPRPRVVVYQGIPKGGKLEQIVQDLAEVGVEEIVPLRTARSIPRWDAGKQAARLERWRAVAREAAMQSRRAWLPVVGPPASFDAIPAETLLLHEEAADGFGAALPAEAPAVLRIAVGPEGGFSAEEVAAAQARGAVPVRLGPTVLRTETAAVVAVAACLARYGRLG